jgi:hypothetical protein
MDNIGDRKEAYLYYPSDKTLNYHEILVQKLNYWRSQLVDRTANYHEAVSRFVADPTGSVPTARGEDMSFADIVDARLVALKETKSLVVIGEKMLAELATSQDCMFDVFLKDEVLKPSTQWLAIDKKDLEPADPVKPEVNEPVAEPEEEKGTGAISEDEGNK